MLWTILAIIILLVVAYILFVNFYPTFGGNVSSEKQKIYQSSPNYAHKKFQNLDASVPPDMSLGETLGLVYKFFTTSVPNGRPAQDLKVQKLTEKELILQDSTQLIWFGHSTFYLKMNGKNILIDPMFGKVAAPHPWLGANRFNSEFPIEIEDLPTVDAVIISHDHYDHLDYDSIKALKEKVKHFYVPLGVGVHLEAWGIKPHMITELDWWQEVMLDDIQLACTPAQHFSGRKIGAEQSTLWSSWVIQSPTENLFFSGDSGYSNHFTAIGEKYGPFNLALMECGQYNEQWSEIHMMPEETAQAGIDLNARAIMPIHWAGFKLALHDWRDPVERVTKASKQLDLPVITPQIGEVIHLNDAASAFDAWWK
ncbi:putative outer membrane protein romA [Flavobacteria bacterium BBFL7]|nr:putative outer membrane protein romA [Flavobacteria bacterium BBFL7]